MYADYQEVRANPVDARVGNHESKKVMTIEMSFLWISNREKKSEEKTMKYGPLKWELKEQYKGYEVHQYNIIMDVLGGWSKETEISVRSLVGRKTTQVLDRMQKAVVQGTEGPLSGIYYLKPSRMFPPYRFSPRPVLRNSVTFTKQRFNIFNEFVLFLKDNDDCYPNLCANGGTCFDVINGYRCNCDAGFTGRNCTISTFVSAHCKKFCMLRIVFAFSICPHRFRAF